MEAKELRIGNYYLGYNNNVEKVDFELFNLLWLKVELDEIIKEPIPLTEEWLLRFGFVYDDDDGIITYSKGNIIIFQRYRLDFYFELNNFEDAPLEYVHSLQNLYFALTGQELEYQKPTEK